MPKRRRVKGYFQKLFKISSDESQDNYLMGYADANWAEVIVSRTLARTRCSLSLSSMVSQFIYLSEAWRDDMRFPQTEPTMSS